LGTKATSPITPHMSAPTVLADSFENVIIHTRLYSFERMVLTPPTHSMRRGGSACLDLCPNCILLDFSIKSFSKPGQGRKDSPLATDFIASNQSGSSEDSEDSLSATPLDFGVAQLRDEIGLKIVDLELVNYRDERV